MIVSVSSQVVTKHPKKKNCFVFRRVEQKRGKKTNSHGAIFAGGPLRSPSSLSHTRAHTHTQTNTHTHTAKKRHSDGAICAGGHLRSPSALSHTRAHTHTHTNTHTHTCRCWRKQS